MEWVHRRFCSWSEDRQDSSCRMKTWKKQKSITNIHKNKHPIFAKHDGTNLPSDSTYTQYIQYILFKHLYIFSLFRYILVDINTYIVCDSDS